jgi:CarD family transcriptional regulator, regulator of rRNA transcription
MGHAQDARASCLAHLLNNAGDGNEPAQEQNGVSRDMNLAGQKSNFDCSDQTHAAPDISSDQPRASQPQQRSKMRFGFKADDYVVYPAHGAGQILAIQEQTIAGASLELFVVYFAKSKMTLRVPTRKAANVGMRRLSDPTAMQRVRRTLSQAPHKARGNWSRLAQEYQSKINSGDIIAIAEVMRDLYRPAINYGQSYSERQLYTSALDRLSGEVALVDSITEEEAVRELESLVTTGVR